MLCILLKMCYSNLSVWTTHDEILCVFCCLVRREDEAPVAAGQAADQVDAGDANENVIT